MNPHSACIRAIATVLLCCLSANCSTSAVVHRGALPPIAGPIESSNADTLYIRDAADDVQPISAREITDISHPGKALALTGLAIGTLGIVGAATIDDSGGLRVGPPDNFMFIVIAAAGAVLALTGGGIYAKSKVAARHLGPHSRP